MVVNPAEPHLETALTMFSFLYSSCFWSIILRKSSSARTSSTPSATSSSSCLRDSVAMMRQSALDCSQ